MTSLAGAPAARAWHAATAVLVGAALLLQISLVAANGQVSMPERLLRLVSYFTVEANLLVLVSCAQLALRPDRDGLGWRVARLGGLVGISVTFLMYLLVLRPAMHLTGWDAVADVGLHYVSPVLMVGGWVLFGPRRRVGPTTALVTLAWPVGWFVWILLFGAVGDFYPYPFVDVRNHGYGGVLLRALLATTLLGAVVAGAWTLDRRLNATAPHGWVPPWERGDRTATLRP